MAQLITSVPYIYKKLFNKCSTFWEMQEFWKGLRGYPVHMIMTRPLENNNYISLSLLLSLYCNSCTSVPTLNAPVYLNVTHTNKNTNIYSWISSCLVLTICMSRLLTRLMLALITNAFKYRSWSMLTNSFTMPILWSSPQVQLSCNFSWWLATWEHQVEVIEIPREREEGGRDGEGDLLKALLLMTHIQQLAQCHAQVMKIMWFMHPMTIMISMQQHSWRVKSCNKFT